MTLFDELYFEITVTGVKSELRKLASFIRSGELDDFFEYVPGYIDYRDGYEDQDDGEISGFVFTNDDDGIEIDEFDTDEFLEIICKAGKRIYLKGQIFDADNDEYSFISEIGNSYYINALLVNDFNEDEDKPHEDEDEDED
jgi:hypothetical protein